MGKILIIKNADFSKVAVDVVAIAPTITISNGGVVTISCDGASSIYYTIDGSTPTINSSVYSEPFTLTTSTTIKAIAKLQNGNMTSVTTAEFKVAELVKTISGRFDYNGTLIAWQGTSYANILVYSVSPNTTYTLHGPTPVATDPGYGGIAFFNSTNDVVIGATGTIDNNYGNIANGESKTFTVPANMNCVCINDNYAEQTGNPYITI